MLKTFYSNNPDNMYLQKLATTVIASKQSEPTDVTVTAQDFDPLNPDKKPKGWADIKLRKVYMKEWQDRKDGVDNEDIMDRRYQREREVRWRYTLRLIVDIVLYIVYLCHRKCAIM